MGRDELRGLAPPKQKRAPGATFGRKTGAVEAEKLCFVVNSSYSRRSHVACGDKTGRFLGGHAAGRDQQGCAYFVVCLCGGCADRGLNYREYNGRVFTVEQFYEHGTGRRSEEDPAAWREAITMTSAPTYKNVPLGEWLRRESAAIHDRDAGNLTGSRRLWLYWPGEAKWYHCAVVDHNPATGESMVEYTADDSVEGPLLLAGEIIKPGTRIDPPEPKLGHNLEQLLAPDVDRSEGGDGDGGGGEAPQGRAGGRSRKAAPAKPVSSSPCKLRRKPTPEPATPAKARPPSRRPPLSAPPSSEEPRNTETVKELNPDAQAHAGTPWEVVYRPVAEVAGQADTGGHLAHLGLLAEGYDGHFLSDTDKIKESVASIILERSLDVEGSGEDILLVLAMASQIFVQDLTARSWQWAQLDGRSLLSRQRVKSICSKMGTPSMWGRPPTLAHSGLRRQLGMGGFREATSENAPPVAGQQAGTLAVVLPKRQRTALEGDPHTVAACAVMESLRMSDELEALLEEVAARRPELRGVADTFLVMWGRAGDIQRQILHRQAMHAAQRGMGRLESYLSAASRS